MKRLLRIILFSSCVFVLWIAITNNYESGNSSSNFRPQSKLKTAATVFSPAKSNSTSTVAICLIIRNETLYLDEWMDFHIALGFAPIYVYDNMLGPDLELEMWFKRRKDIQEHVKIIHFPMAPVQHPAYDRCIKRDAANETYAAMIDIDEYVVLKKHDNIVDFMEEHCKENCGQISLNWNMMSVSNETSYRPIPVLKRNIHTTGVWGTVKVIVRPTYVADAMDWSHSVALKRGDWVDTTGSVIPRPRNWKKQANYAVPSDVALLYHFRFRSPEEYFYKNCIRGDSLQKRGDVPKCTRGVAKTGMYGGDVDDLAWQQLIRMVPKYRIFDNRTDVTMSNLSLSLFYHRPEI